MEVRTGRGQAEGSGLILTLEIAEPVVVGLSVPAIIQVANRGPAPATISARLNLAEGDVRLSITQPDGAVRAVKGWQADTALRRVTLPPGEHIEGGINLLSTGSGPAFPTPGNYVLRAEYDPSPRAETVVSDPVAVAARLPETEPERAVAELLEDEAAREALVFAKSDAAPDKLAVLAQQHGGTRDGKLARLLLLGGALGGAESSVLDSADAFQLADPVTLARWITMLSTPYSDAGARLAEDFASRLRPHGPAARGGKAEDAAALDRALRIVRRLPIGGS